MRLSDTENSETVRWKYVQERRSGTNHREQVHRRWNSIEDGILENEKEMTLLFRCWTRTATLIIKRFLQNGGVVFLISLDCGWQDISIEIHSLMESLKIHNLRQRSSQWTGDSRRTNHILLLLWQLFLFYQLLFMLFHSWMSSVFSSCILKALKTSPQCLS